MKTAYNIVLAGSFNSAHSEPGLARGSQPQMCYLQFGVVHKNTQVQARPWLHNLHPPKPLLSSRASFSHHLFAQVKNKELQGDEACDGGHHGTRNPPRHFTRSELSHA